MTQKLGHYSRQNFQYKKHQQKYLERSGTLKKTLLNLEKETLYQNNIQKEPY